MYLSQPVRWLYSQSWTFQRQYVLEDMISHHTSSAAYDPGPRHMHDHAVQDSYGIVRLSTSTLGVTLYDIGKDFFQRSPESGLRIRIKDQDPA